MANDGSLRGRLLRRFKIGCGILLLLAVPAIVYSHAAIETMLNQPAQWVPDSLREKADFKELGRHFSVSDIVFLSWPTATLDSQSLEDATQATRLLCIGRGHSNDQSSDPNIDPLSDQASRYVAQIREICGAQQPFAWVSNGAETLTRMTSSPARLRQSTAVARLKGTMVAADGKQSCMVLSLGETGNAHRRVVLPILRDLIREVTRSERVVMVGSPLDGAVVDDESVRSVRLFTPPCVIIAAILCFICLRSIWLTGVITVVALIGQGIVLAAVYWSGVSMNAVLIVLPPLVFVLTVSAGIHLSNYYLDACREFADLNEVGAARYALRSGTAPCLLATATTVAGLGSLALVRLEPVRVFGLVASLGVMITLGLLLLMLPGAMVLTTRKPHDDESQAELGRLRGSGRKWMRGKLARPWPMIIIFTLAAAYFSIGLSQLKTTVSSSDVPTR